MKIVVPLDLSPTAEAAIGPAIELARALGDEIVLVTVTERKLERELQDFAEVEHARVPELIANSLESMAATLDGLAAGTEMLPSDDAAEAIVDYATADRARMIVMATHGRSGVSRWRMGSVAERVVRHSTVPVLVVPAREPA